MTQYLNLTQVTNPVAQTIRITEPGGVVLTGVGLYFYSKPSPTAPNLPVNVEIRPVTEGGTPSGLKVYPGTITNKTRADITANTSFDATTGETKFTFESPLYVPENTEVALVIHTNAAPGDYQIWSAELGAFVFGTTEKRITNQPYVGSFFSSANGTTWTPEQKRDLTFKLYNAKFTNQRAIAKFAAATPPVEKLTSNTLETNPLFFTAGTNRVKVLHPNHGLMNGDTVRLTGLDSSETYSGVLGSSILGKKSVSERDPFGYTIVADSDADSDIRAGGNLIYSTGQQVFDQFKVNMPVSVPDGSTVKSNIQFRSFKPYGTNDGAYNVHNRNIEINKYQVPPVPGVIANRFQDSDRNITKGSLKVAVRMDMLNQNTAPYINANAASMSMAHHLIDNNDSAGAFAGADGYDSSGANGFNMVKTIPYIAETEPFAASSLARHITKVVTLQEKATSMKVFVDAHRPNQTGFSVWYRTSVTNDEIQIGDKNWIKFNTNQTTANRSNYDDMATNDIFSFKEYFFTQFDLPEFDQFQVKIVMNSEITTKIPVFKNLRIISTI